MKNLTAPLFLLLLAAPTAYADGVGPQRKMTAAEVTACDQVRAAVQAALPGAADGYTVSFERVSDLDEGMVPEALQPTQMLRMVYKATYTLDPEFRAEQQQASMLDRTKGTPEQQKRAAELSAREAELREARDHTRSSAEKEKIRAELKAVRTEQDALTDEIAAGIQAWIASGGPNAAAQGLDQSLPPRELSIWVRINDNVSLNDKAAPCTVPGAPLAFELSEGCQEYEYCVLIFLGRYDKVKKISGYTLYQPPGVDLGVSTRARAIALTVNGPKQRPEAVRAFAAKIDLAKLAALLP